MLKTRVQIQFGVPKSAGFVLARNSNWQRIVSIQKLTNMPDLNASKLKIVERGVRICLFDGFRVSHFFLLRIIDGHIVGHPTMSLTAIHPDMDEQIKIFYDRACRLLK
ncbi:unnamed protein product [Protopolystoma xenopodis]|uniref:Uncharacterized protein n=1 Tax=Protopolystoma xenopodis TaxID=117903 RepID=A0A3S5C404_9PLAT|nr:unnamed protein product [Protopolystoma xenopodis]